MVRVEWTALGGDQVETLIANLMYNRDGRAVRVRPSRGDYGIDIILPASTNPKLWDVYQVKKFALNLTSSQKTQIVDSFARALLGMLRRGVPLNNWYLTLPLDPTLENYLDWLKTLPELAIKHLASTKPPLDPPLGEDELGRITSWLETPGRIIGWKGLDFCEGLAADHPYVVDYYLHGGAQRIKDAVRELALLLQADAKLPEGDTYAAPAEGSSALMQPGDVRDHLIRLDGVLDTDPHFRYGHSLDVNAPALRPEPGLVAATQESIRGDRWLTFKIYARSAQSLDERPIPIRLNFEFEAASDEHEAFKEWLKYGKPFDGTVSFDADLPGGLDTKDAKGLVRIGPAEGEVEPFRNRQRILTPDGTPLSELAFTATSTTGIDGTGMWAHAVDDSGTLSCDMTTDMTSLTHTLKFTLKPLAGLEAAKALAAIIFASQLTEPNRLQVAAQYGPFHDSTPLPEGTEPLVPQPLVQVVQALATVQSRTRQPVLITDFSQFTSQEIHDLCRAASLINGQTVVATWEKSTYSATGDVEVGAHLELEAGMELRLPKITGDQVLGFVKQTIPSATVAAIDGDQVTFVPYKDATMYMTLVEQLPDAPPGKTLLRGRPIE